MWLRGAKARRGRRGDRGQMQESMQMWHCWIKPHPRKPSSPPRSDAHADPRLSKSTIHTDPSKLPSRPQPKKPAHGIQNPARNHFNRPAGVPLSTAPGEPHGGSGGHSFHQPRSS